MWSIYSHMGDLGARSGHLAALALALAMALGGWTSCNWGEQRALPPPLLGTWTTDAPRYRGRSLEVHAESVVLYERGRPIDRYHIEGVRSWSGTRGQVYELRCVTDEGLRDALRLTYVAGPPPHVTIGEAPPRWGRSRGP